MTYFCDQGKQTNFLSVLGSIIPDLLYWEVLWIVITISWKRNKIIARHLQSQENIWKRGQTTMPQADFEPMIPKFIRC